MPDFELIPEGMNRKVWIYIYIYKHNEGSTNRSQQLDMIKICSLAAHEWARKMNNTSNKSPHTAYAYLESTNFSRLTRAAVERIRPRGSD